MSKSASSVTDSQEEIKERIEEWRKFASQTIHHEDLKKTSTGISAQDKTERKWHMCLLEPCDTENTRLRDRLLIQPEIIAHLRSPHGLIYEELNNYNVNRLEIRILYKELEKLDEEIDIPALIKLIKKWDDNKTDYDGCFVCLLGCDQEIDFSSGLEKAIESHRKDCHSGDNNVLWLDVIYQKTALKSQPPSADKRKTLSTDEPQESEQPQKKSRIKSPARVDKKISFTKWITHPSHSRSEASLSSMDSSSSKSDERLKSEEQEQPLPKSGEIPDERLTEEKPENQQRGRPELATASGMHSAKQEITLHCQSCNSQFKIQVSVAAISGVTCQVPIQTSGEVKVEPEEEAEAEPKEKAEAVTEEEAEAEAEPEPKEKAEAEAQPTEKATAQTSEEAAEGIQHSMQSFENRPICEICGKKTHDMKKHLKHKHHIAEMGEGYECISPCKKRFGTINEMKYHKLTSHPSEK